MKTQATILTALILTLILSGNSFAAKEKFERTKPHVNVGTIGQIDDTKQPGNNIKAADSRIDCEEKSKSDPACK